MKDALEAMTEAQRVSLVLAGEARSEPIEGIVAVASVMRNRVKAQRFGEDFSDVVTAPKQFSCLFPAGGKQNYKRMLALAQQFARKEPVTDPKILQCIAVAECVMREYVADNTQGSTHYAVYTLTPYWAKGLKPVRRIGTHQFWNNVP